MGLNTPTVLRSGTEDSPAPAGPGSTSRVQFPSRPASLNSPKQEAAQRAEDAGVFVRSSSALPDQQQVTKVGGAKRISQPLPGSVFSPLTSIVV